MVPKRPHKNQSILKRIMCRAFGHPVQIIGVGDAYDEVVINCCRCQMLATLKIAGLRMTLRDGNRGAKGKSVLMAQ